MRQKRLVVTKRLKKDKVMNFIGFDVETSNRNKDFLCGSLAYKDKNMSFRDKQQMVDEMLSVKNNKAYFVATNLKFDFCQLFFGSEVFKYSEKISRGTNLIIISVYKFENKFYRKRPNARALKFTFIDTNNYVPGMSVEAIGAEILKLPKLEKPECLGHIPKNEQEWKYMLEYNIRDSEISRMFMCMLLDFFNMMQVKMKNTIAASAMTTFKTLFLDREVFSHDKNVLKDLFNGYKGAYCMANVSGHIKTKTFMMDINSMYPHAMKECWFPEPNFIRFTRHNDLAYITNYEGISEVTVNIPYNKHPCLAFKTKDKVIFPYGDRIRGFWTHLELNRLLKEGGKIVCIHKCYYFTKTWRPFVGFVDTMYKMRMQYQKEGSSLEYFVKIILNSLYGKFGEKFMDKEMMIHQDALTAKDKDKFSSITPLGGPETGFLRCTGEMEPAAHCFPEISAYVTAFARLKIIDLVRSHNALYADTDSIITTTRLEDSSELGELKCEAEFDEVIIVRPKVYAGKGKIFSKHKIKPEKVKLKGVSRRLTFLDFYGLEQNNVIKYEKFSSIKEALRRGITPNVIIDHCKKISLGDTKRVWKRKFKMDIVQESEPPQLEDVREFSKYIDIPIDPKLFAFDDCQIEHEA